MLTGAELIAFERGRQINEKGFTSTHDDEHIDGSLLAASSCYLALGLMFVRADHPHASMATHNMPIGPTGWPWLDGYKADLSGPIPNLVKAGALIAAEIDRLQRNA